MKLTKIVASALAFSTALGIAGCNSHNKKKDREEIDSLVQDYVEAMREFDYEPLAEVTAIDFEKEYSWFINVTDYPNTDFLDEFTYEYCKYTASTIEADYDIEDIEFEEDEATLKVTFSIVDWTSVCWGTFDDTESMLDVLKNTDERRTIKDKLTFEYSDGEWELVKSKSFTDIMIFYCNTPALYSYYEWIDETEPEPEPTESTQPEPVTHEQFLGAMDYYHYELIVSSDSIIAMQNSYMDKLCFEHDFNGDGSPEMCYFARNPGTGDSYLEYCEYIPLSDGIVFNYIAIPDACINPDKDGSFVLYATEKEFVFTCSYTEDNKTIVETEVYNFSSFPEGYYRLEKDLATGKEECFTNLGKDYGEDDPMDVSQYNSVIKDLTDRASLIFVERNNDLQFAPGISHLDELRTYEEAVEYYESFQ